MASVTLKEQTVNIRVAADYIGRPHKKVPLAGLWWLSIEDEATALQRRLLHSKGRNSPFFFFWAVPCRQRRNPPNNDLAGCRRSAFGCWVSD